MQLVSGIEVALNTGVVFKMHFGEMRRHHMLTCSAERSTSLTTAEVPASWPHGVMSEMWSLTAGDSSGCSRS